MTTMIVGGGITGLAAALRLREAGREVLLLEGSARFGGKIETESQSGYQLEWGPHSIVSTGEALFELIDHLELSSDLIQANDAAKFRYVVHRGALVRLPGSPPGLFSTPLLSWRERFRVIGERWVRSKGDDEESAAEFVSRRFGPAIAERFLAPFVSGIYAGDANRLEMASAFPKLVAYEREHGSVIRGLSKSRFSSDRRRGTFGFPSGMETVVHAAVSHLGSAARSGQVQSLRRSGAGFEVRFEGDGSAETLSAQRVIVATPAGAAAQLLQPIDPDLSGELAAIEYAPVGLMQLGVRTADLPRPLDGFGFLLRPDGTTPLLGCIWSSAVFDNRAPKDHALLSVFVGGSHTPPGAEPNAMFDEALASLQFYMGGEFEPAFRSQRWIERAIPQLNIGHKARVARIRNAIAEVSGLAIAGGHLDGVSLHDCVRSGSAVGDV